MGKKKKNTTRAYPTHRPPVVTVLGHVDHGKTTLLDYIRKSSKASQEHGGITQHIGAYQVSVNGKFITFIDTPGHEAFGQMRARGARVADIAILVVAADDSVKPQTKESIAQIQASKAAMIVVANKIDVSSADVNRVKQDLAKESVQVEGFGGEIPFVPISAKTGDGVDTLLKKIISVWEQIKAEAKIDEKLSAVVIETKVDKGKGMVATLLPQTGVLRRRTELYENDEIVARVRAMFDEAGDVVAEAIPSQPVEVLGFNSLPQVGTILRSYPVVDESRPEEDDVEDDIPDFLKPIDQQEGKKLVIILKADTAGSLEAVKESLGDRVTIASEGVGDINENDVKIASSTQAFIVGFGVKIGGSVRKLAEVEKVVYRIYPLIYELLEELEEVISGMEEVITKEREVGRGDIVAEFPFKKTRVAGTRVTSGRIAMGDKVKVMRGEKEIGRGKVISIRRGKEEVTKVAEGLECGVILEGTIDFQINDGIIAFTSS